MKPFTRPPEIKIAVFIASSEGLGGGGAEQVVLNITRGFAEQGYKTDLVLLKVAGVFIPKIHPTVTVINLDVASDRPGLTLRKILALRRYLQAEQPSVFFANSDTDNTALWARLLAGVSTQMISVIHAPFSEIIQWMTSRPKRYMTLWSYQWIDKIITCSQGVAEDFCKTTGLSKTRLKVIYNPIVNSEILDKGQESLEHPWFAPGSPPVILGVGRLVKIKDFSTLIQAVSQAAQHRPMRLIILGEGEERPQLEALIETLGLAAIVRLEGFQINPFAYLARAALFVLSSLFEGFGNVLVEAMTLGTPVIATHAKGGGPAEILANGQYGQLVPIGDPVALAAAILNTLAHPPDPAILQQRSRDFSLAASTAAYLSVVKHNPQKRL
jgi:glycosyltransferase involved in cell wall biosynthesis